MGKLALIVIAILVAMFWLRFKLGRKDQGAGSRDAPPPVARDAGRMIACTHCGVLFPAIDAALDASGRSYCSGAHLDAHARLP